MLFVVIWRRNGVAVPFITAGSLLLFNFIFGQSYTDHIAPKVFAFLLAAAAIFAITRFTEEDGDHFFFVPLKFWPPIVAIVGTIVAIGITDTHAKPVEPPAQAATQPQPAQPATYQPSPVQAEIVTPPPQPRPQPAVATQAEAPAKLAQVDVDSSTRLYYTEGCAGRPANTTRLAKSVAVMQGYKPAPGCGS